MFLFTNMSYIIVEVSIPANFTIMHIDFTLEFIRSNLHFKWFNDLLKKSYTMKFTRFMDFITDKNGYIISQSQHEQRLYYTLYMPPLEENDINET